MITAPGLKLNTYKRVTIPRLSELVKAYGLTRPGHRYSGDETVNLSQSKIDAVKQVADNAFEA